MCSKPQYLIHQLELREHTSWHRWFCLESTAGNQYKVNNLTKFLLVTCKCNLDNNNQFLP